MVFALGKLSSRKLESYLNKFENNNYRYYRRMDIIFSGNTSKNN